MASFKVQYAADGSSDNYTGDSRYSIDDGVLTVHDDPGSKKVIYSPVGWYEVIVIEV